MSVMQDLAAGGVEGGIIAAQMQPLALTLVSLALALFAVLRRQDRLRRARATRPAPSTEGLCPEQSRARSARLWAAPLSALKDAGQGLLRATGADHTAASGAARGAASQPAGPPRGGAERIGLAQISLRTTPRYRLFACALVLLSQGLVFGTPLLLPAAAETTTPLRLFGYGLCLLALWHAVWALRWRLDYDSIGLACRNRWLRPEARMWRALTAISSDGPFITLFHFADGMVMRVPSFISGRREMMQTARSWLRQAKAPDRP